MRATSRFGIWNIDRAPFTVDAHGLRWDGDLLGADRPCADAEIETARQWLAMWGKPARSLHHGSSHGLKDQVEAWQKWLTSEGYSHDGMRPQVSNGAFIRAAIDALCDIKVEDGNRNCGIYISTTGWQNWRSWHKI